jgi:hypothetical protein
MKKLILKGIIFLYIICDINGQSPIYEARGNLIFEDTLEFHPLHSWIIINNPETNIWEIGKPEKKFFNAAYTGNLAILTDSVDNYSINCDDYFYITIPRAEYEWGEGILSFYHKFDTDSLIDGGVIEMSYDNGITWLNVLDGYYNVPQDYLNLYEDTIKGGKYGFSGKSNIWQYVEIYWAWIILAKTTNKYLDSPMIKFRFISDENNTNKEGWMIDDIVFRGYEIVPATSNIEKSILMVYPIPSNEYLLIEFHNENSKDLIFEIYELHGRSVKSQKIINNQIYISDLKNGIYFYKIFNDKEIVKIGKFIKY